MATGGLGLLLIMHVDVYSLKYSNIIIGSYNRILYTYVLGINQISIYNLKEGVW